MDRRQFVSGSLVIATSILANGCNLQFPSDVVVAFGDSITEGGAASDAAHRWPNIVAKARGWSLVNSGIGGTPLQNTIQNTIAVRGSAAANNGRDTYESRVSRHAPAWALMLYGLNDVRLNDGALSAALFQNDLVEVVEGIVSAGLAPDRIVLGSPTYITVAAYGAHPPYDAGSAQKFREHRDAVAAVAAERRTRFIDVYAWMADHGGDSLLSAGGVHPNDAGHRAIADAFLSVI